VGQGTKCIRRLGKEKEEGNGGNDRSRERERWRVNKEEVG